MNFNLELNVGKAPMYFYYSKRNSKILMFFHTLSVLALVLLFTGMTNAQSGRIMGKVIDSKDKDPLPGASVYLEGTVIGTATSIEGVYSLSNLKPGNYKVVFSYVGYESKVIPVTITAGKTVALDAALSWSSKEVGEVVVTGQLEGQAQAINQQRNSDQIVNVVSEEKIKELPDANAAESAGRLPGVAVQRDGGEATKLMIRGLDPKFTNVSINGINVPASDGDNRSVDLSMFSQSSLSGIELYKSLTPDQDGDALAGSINLVTAQARAGQKLTLSATGIYSGLRQTARQYKVSGQYSNRFFNDFLGVQAEINSEQRDRSDETYTDSWNLPEVTYWDYQISNLSVGITDETRKRYGGDIDLDINTGDGGNIKFLNSYSNTKRNQFLGSRDYVALGDAVSYSGEVIDLQTYTFNNSVIGVNNWEGAKISWAFSHAYTYNSKPFDVSMQFNEGQSDTSGMKSITNSNIFRLSGKYLIPYAWNNFSQSTLYSSYFYQEQNSERNYEAKADIEYPVRISDSFDAIFKGGYKFRDKIRHRTGDVWYAPYLTRSSQAYTLNANGNIVPKDWASSPWPNGSTGIMTDYFNSGTTRTVNKDYILNPVLNPDLIREWYNFNKNGVNSTGKYKEYVYQLESLKNKYNTTENVQGTYLMAKLNLGSYFTILGGVRYEYEINSYNANYVPKIIGENETQQATIFDTTKGYIKGFVLPNLHIKFQPYEWWDVKLAATKSISRPDYSMRLPTMYINGESQQITACNPNLQDAIAWNFDANTSFYSSTFGLLTLSGFKKNIDNMFYWVSGIPILNNAEAQSYGIPLNYGAVKQFTLDIPLNTQGTQIWGYEIELQAHFGFLPGLLQNIVFSANYSRIWSKTYTPYYSSITDPKTFKTSLTIDNVEDVLNGQTDYIGNASLGYDYKKFSGRISVTFQGPYLYQSNAIKRRNVYENSFSRWDLALKQGITDDLTVFLNINNLTNTIESRYENYLNLEMGGHLYGLSADLGVQVSIL